MDNKKIIDLLKKSGFETPESSAARTALAAALRVPINREIEKGNLARTLFMVDYITEGQQAIYPRDIAPGKAYALPRIGSAPQHIIGLEDIFVPCFEITDSREWRLQVAREGRINIVQRAVRSMANAVTKLENQGAWEAIKGVPYRSAQVTGATNLTKTVFNTGFQKMQSLDGYNVDVVVINAVRAGDVREWSSNDLDQMTMREVWRNAGMGNIWGADIIVDNEVPDDEAWFFDTEKMGIMPIKMEFTTYDSPGAIERYRQRILGYEEIGLMVTDPNAIVKLSIG